MERPFNKISMKKTLFLLALSTLFASSISHAQAKDTCSYTITRDVQYGEGLVMERGVQKHIPLYLDIYLPTKCQNGSDQKPVPIGQIHGGGFIKGDKDSGETTKINLARNGYAVFSINYRLLSYRQKPIIESLSEEATKKFVAEFMKDGATQEQVYGALIATEDAIKAKEFVQKKFDGKIDTRWFLYGGSAGAVTSLNVAYLADYVFGKKEHPTGVIEISGSIPTGQHMSPHDANVLIIHGTEDTVIPYEKSNTLIAQAQEANVPYQRITAIGSGHGLMGNGLFSWKVHETGLTVFDHMLRFIELSLACQQEITDQCRNYPAELTTQNPGK
jgi:hypothetical protein